MTRQLTVGELFAGVGSFSAGFEQAGMRTVWQVEIDDAANRVLEHHWPDVKRYKDVRECGKNNLDKVDIVTGGFPCQDLSAAGKRTGLRGERSGLFFEMVRIVDELRPMLLCWENVPRLLSSFSPIEPPPDAVEGAEWEVEEDSDFETVLYELASIGYCGGVSCFNSEFFGVPQRRERLFGVFARADIGAELCCKILAFKQRGKGNTQTRGQKRQSATSTTRGSVKAGRSKKRRDKEEQEGQGFFFAPDERQAETGATADAGEEVETSGQQEIAATLRSRCSSPGVSQPGRGGEDDQNLVVVVTEPIAFQATGAGSFRSGELSLAASDDNGSNQVVVAVNNDSRASTSSDVASPERAGHRGQQAVAYNIIGLAQQGRNHAYETNISGCLQHKGLSASGNEAGTVIAFQERGRDGGPNVETQEDVAYSLNAPVGGGRRQEMNIATGMMVRRLTPTEFLRLMGLSDSYFDLEPPLSDSVKYRLCGNSIVFPVTVWLGRRIVAAMGEVER